MIKMNNETTFDWQVPYQSEFENYIRESMNEALLYEGIDFPCEVEVLIVDEDTIQQINHEYRQIDKVTDVLSFPMYENASEASQDVIGGQPLMLGSMVLCLDKALKQAEEYEHSLQREISFLTVHSILHLLGYDHELGEREESEMFRKQHEILEKMGVTR